jgi:hypothetical protein
VVARELLQAAVAVQVDAAVAGPQAGGVDTAGEQGDDGAAHDGHLARVGFLAQGPVHPGQFRARGLDEIGQAGGRRQAGEPVHDGAAGKVAEGVSAHAVRHGPQPAFGLGQVGIFIAAAHETDVRARGGSPTEYAVATHRIVRVRPAVL